MEAIIEDLDESMELMQVSTTDDDTDDTVLTEDETQHQYITINKPEQMIPDGHISVSIYKIVCLFIMSGFIILILGLFSGAIIYKYALSHANKRYFKG